MILNLHSLAFNTITESGGGNPAWGTEMGQGDGYRFHFEDADEFITALVYNSIPNPKERIYCPLGKGGNQADDYEFVLGSLFNKVYVNGIKVNGKFLLLVVKKLVGANHVGRRTLKYNPRITLDGINYNEPCFAEMAKALGVSSEGSWFVSEINVHNQDELHFTAYVLDKDNTYYFADSTDRSKKLQEIILANAQAKDSNKYKTYFESTKFDQPLQQIVFGAPGTGKSHRINSNAAISESNSIRTTFHPDSDYSTFVGCYKPTKDSESKEITYEFCPQAFTNAYVNAWKDLEEPYYLIIEEINRGNCAQIFGDIFQLLDRDENGFSSYKITPDQDLANYLRAQFEDADIDDEDIKSGCKMQLPNNLHIWATMNTSDQSLFPIDSAFKRRWDWKYMPIDYTNHGHYISCDDKKYSWSDFLEKVNEHIEATTQSEDKKLGYWFLARKDHNEITTELFVSKVIFYLWNDIFKDFATAGNSIFKDEYSKFHKFFDYNGNAKSDVVKQFLDNLGVVSTNAENDESDSTESGKLKFSLNGGEPICQRQLAKEALEEYKKNHRNYTAQQVIDDWKELSTGTNFIVTKSQHNARVNKTPSWEKRADKIELDNNEVVFISLHGWVPATTRAFVEAINAKNWGINITEVKV